MKKILLSLLMLCTALSAWSYGTKTITLYFEAGGFDAYASWKTTDSETGIYVSAPKANDVDGCWKVEKFSPLQMEVPDGYVITGVEFDYFSESYLKARGVNSSGSIDNCDNLALNGQRWEQKDGAFSRITMIKFRCMNTSAYVRSVTITYHKHTFTHHGAVAATCVATGMKEYWECSDCGHIYSNESGASEATMASLVIAATNHKDSMREIAEVPATCVEKGKMHHWHCDACGGNFEDKEGTTPLTDEGMVIDFNPANHPDALEEHARVEATCTTAGNVRYWHCSHCNKDFGDKEGTTPAINDVTIPATNHKNKTFTEAVAPTTETEGNVAYYHCPDCEKYFGDDACTNELTEWILEKLMNMMHLDFNGTSAPVETEHYMNTAKFNFTDDGNIILTVNDKSVTYDKNMLALVTFSNGTPTVAISANEDPGKGVYYSTFYSGLESYAVPEGVTAYTGVAKDDVLLLTPIAEGLIPTGEAVILRATPSETTSMQTTFSLTATTTSTTKSDDNMLQGSDGPMTLPANSYALSYGQHQLGFYDFSGSVLPANKAYLTLDASAAQSVGLRFSFGDATEIDAPVVEPANAPAYNLQGQQVDETYRGIVIVNGKKVLKR